MAELIDMQKCLSDEEEKLVLKFMSALTKLDTIKIFGCARTLGIQVAFPAPEGTKATPENMSKYMRPTEDIITDMIDKYLTLNRKDRRLLLDMLKAAK